MHVNISEYLTLHYKLSKPTHVHVSATLVILREVPHKGYIIKTSRNNAQTQNIKF